MRKFDEVDEFVIKSLVLPVALWAQKSRDGYIFDAWYRKRVLEVIAILSHAIAAVIRYPSIFIAAAIMKAALIIAKYAHSQV